MPCVKQCCEMPIASALWAVFVKIVRLHCVSQHRRCECGIFLQKVGRHVDRHGRVKVKAGCACCALLCWNVLDSAWPRADSCLPKFLRGVTVCSDQDLEIWIWILCQHSDWIYIQSGSTALDKYRSRLMWTFGAGLVHLSSWINHRVSWISSKLVGKQPQQLSWSSRSVFWHLSEEQNHNLTSNSWRLSGAENLFSLWIDMLKSTFKVMIYI